MLICYNRDIPTNYIFYFTLILILKNNLQEGKSGKMKEIIINVTSYIVGIPFIILIIITISALFIEHLKEK